MFNSKNDYQGKYKQIQMIGKGRFGTIYRIQSTEDGKDYVAKHIPLDQIEESVAQKQLEIIKNLRHPYIVAYIDSFTVAEEFIIIMEYCKEKDLDHQIQLMKSKNKHFNENLVITWLFQLVLGVQFIHSKKILHRDIKPQNIFIDENLNIKIGDFGISKMLSSTGQQCQTMAGTLHYLAPQIIREESYTAKADIWSLGCVIYEICTLEKSFPTNKLLDLIDMIKGNKGSIKDIPNIYSEDVRKLVMKMLTRDQTKRPSTTQLLKDPVLVDLMIKNSSSVSLKKEYAKDIDKPVTLSDSFINNQTNMVHQQLKKFQKEVEMKMHSLKNKNLNNAQIDQQYMELKNKMAEIQKAIGKAFQELKQKAGSNPTQNKSELMKSMKNSSLTDSSEMTIIESVVIGDDPDKKKSTQFAKISTNSSSGSSSNSSGKLAESQMQNSKLQNSSIMSAESMVLQESGELRRSQFLGLNSKVSKLNTNQSESFDQTLQSEYQKTQKSSSIAKETLDKLEFLQKALSRNPDAILNESLLSYTLTMSEEEIKRGMKEAAKSNPALNLKLKTQGNFDDTINFNLTNRTSKELQDSGKLEVAFMKKPNKFEKKPDQTIQVPKIQYSQDMDQYYNEEFEQYEEEFQDELQASKSAEYSGTMSASMKQKRKQELNTIMSFYQMSLQQIENQSQFKQPLTQTQKVKNKYPLQMSQIEEQIGEAGSILSKKNNSARNSSLGI